MSEIEQILEEEKKLLDQRRGAEKKGDPLVGISVAAWVRRPSADGWTSYAQGRTDDRGVYRIKGLPPTASDLPSDWLALERRCVSGATHTQSSISSKRRGQSNRTNA